MGTFSGEHSKNSNIATMEWFELISEEMLHPENGLFQFSSSNSMCIQINPASALSFPDYYLICFRVLGRILAKAVSEGIHISSHMSPHLFKLLVGWPLTVDDLKDIDQACFHYLVNVQNASAQQLSKMKIPFTAMLDVLGSSEEVEICPGGASRLVTIENKSEYLDLSLKHYLFGEVEDQVTELLIGFYDVIPEPLVSVFDAEEIELLMCGVQKIDIEDWKRNTVYTGEFQDLGEYHPVCCWFWDIVENYLDQEARLKLLTFATGLSTVPSGGFANLNGESGQLQKFTLHGMRFEDCPFPQAETLWNRILIPLYESSSLMYETIIPLIEMESESAKSY